RTLYAATRRHTPKHSWKQAADLLRLDDALDADRHSGCSMRHPVFLRSPDYLHKGMLKDAEKFVRHFGFSPQKRLQTLHPLKVRNDHATGIAENVRNHENFVPPLFQNPVCIWCSRAVSCLGKDA